MTFGERCDLLRPVVSPREIAAGAARWLTPGLIPTDAARARLARWVALGGPVADSSELNVIGALEDDAPECVVGALGRMPLPVQHHVIANCTIAIVGRSAAGWVSTLPVPRNPLEAPLVIAIDAGASDPEIQAVFAHEAAHAWLSQPVRPVGAETPLPWQARQAVQQLDRLAEAWGVDDPRPVSHARDELRVATLAHAWGFRGRATDVETFAAALRRAGRNRR